VSSAVVASQVEVHDKYQFDLKVTYPLVRGGGGGDETNYAVDVFLFLPKNFHVSSRNYPATRFFEDIQAYLRLDLREPPLDELAGTSPRSPLGWLAQALRARAGGDRVPPVAEIVDQLRIFACELVQHVRDCEGACRQSRSAVESFEPVVAVIERFRDLKRRFEYHAVDVGPTVLRELRLVDEWVSLTLEEALAGAAGDPNLGPAESMRVARLASAEIAYRRARGYFCLGSHGHARVDDEYFLYRRGQLKKHIQQVLFLDVRSHAAGSSAQQIIAAVGAALAATWWFWAQSSAASGSSTFVLFVVGVVAYILKDRIKEVTRHQLSQKLRRYLPDQASTIQGSGVYGATFKGECRESVHYLHPDELPREVLLARDLHHVVDLGDDIAEEVLHYRKRVTFEGALLERDEARARVRDIVRLGIRDFTEHLDDPKRVVTFFDDAAGKFVSRRAPKIYHLNLVLRYQSMNARGQVTDVSFERVRAILNRKGISRVDIVLPRTPAAALLAQMEPG
jgi:hypothetical protein